MRKMLLLGALLFGLIGTASAELSVRELFRQTEGKVLDFAVLSSLEAGYARDMLNGGNYAVMQSPVVYLTPYITGDFGYITGYDDSKRGALMFGGSLRINKLIEDAFKGKVALVRDFVPVVDSTWDKLWFGPWVSKRFSDFDSSLMGGIKAGLRW